MSIIRQVRPAPPSTLFFDARDCGPPLKTGGGDPSFPEREVAVAKVRDPPLWPDCSSLFVDFLSKIVEGTPPPGLNAHIGPCLYSSFHPPDPWSSRWGAEPHRPLRLVLRRHTGGKYFRRLIVHSLSSGSNAYESNASAAKPGGLEQWIKVVNMSELLLPSWATVGSSLSGWLCVLWRSAPFCCCLPACLEWQL